MIFACDVWNTQFHMKCCSFHTLDLTLDFAKLFIISIHQKGYESRCKWGGEMHSMYKIQFKAFWIITISLKKLLFSLVLGCGFI